LTSAVNDDDSH